MDKYLWENINRALILIRIDIKNTIVKELLQLIKEAAGRYIRGINLIANELDGQKQYYLFNAHGDVVQRTDQSRNVLKSYEYDAFGNEIDAVTIINFHTTIIGIGQIQKSL